MSPLEFCTVTWIVSDPLASLAVQRKDEPTGHTSLLGQTTVARVFASLSTHWVTADRTPGMFSCTKWLPSAALPATATTNAAIHATTFVASVVLLSDVHR